MAAGPDPKIVNGEREASVRLDHRIAQTDAPFTLGGIDDDGRIWQNWHGAMDEVRIYHPPLNADQIRAFYRPLDQRHELPRIVGAQHELWNADQAMPATTDLQALEGIEFHVGTRSRRRRLQLAARHRHRMAPRKTLRFFRPQQGQGKYRRRTSARTRQRRRRKDLGRGVHNRRR